MSDDTLILYIDDNKENLDLVQRVLIRSGFNCLIANNPFTGLTMARDEKPDLILLDIQMPSMTGFEAIKVLRSSFVDRTTPIIALTANTIGANQQVCKEAGFDDYLSKPVLRKELLAKIEKHLNRFANDG